MSDAQTPTIGEAPIPRAPLDRRSELRRAGWPGLAGTPRRLLVLRDDGSVQAWGPEAADAPGPAWRLALPTDHLPAHPSDMFLGIDQDGTAICARADPGDAETSLEGSSWHTLRQIGMSLDECERDLVMTAVALTAWHRSHTHCPRCGTRTEIAGMGWWRTCANDGSDHFPRTDPAVIALIQDAGGSALLGRQARWPPGAFSTIAGFVEPGESAETALSREVLEEVGLTLAGCRYWGSQPWPFPGSLMLGFHATVAGVRPATAVDGLEIEEARWLSREELPALCALGEVRLPGRLSIAHMLIEQWYGQRLEDSWCRW